MVNFQEFLADNDITNYESRLTGKIKEDVPGNWIMNAFYFDDQPEGYGFWKRLDSEWLKICEKQEVCYGGEFPTVPKG